MERDSYDEERDAQWRALLGEQGYGGSKWLIDEWGRFDDVLMEIDGRQHDARSRLRMITDLVWGKVESRAVSMHHKLSQVRRRQIALGFLDDAFASLRERRNMDALSRASDYGALAEEYERAGEWDKALAALREAKAEIPATPSSIDLELGYLGATQEDFDCMHREIDERIAALEARRAAASA